MSSSQSHSGSERQFVAGDAPAADDLVVTGPTKPPVWAGPSSGSADEVQLSVGSEQHASGDCKPCLYMTTKTGCFNGAACTFCHYQHAKKSRPRPCKATRIQCKQIATMLDAFAPDPEQILQATERLGTNSSYMRTILKGRHRNLEEAAASGGAGESKAAAAEAPTEVRTGAPAEAPTEAPTEAPGAGTN